jgi:hypothetical protein
LSGVFILFSKIEEKDNIIIGQEKTLKKTQEMLVTYQKAYRDQREQHIQRVKYDQEELKRIVKEKDVYYENNLRQLLKEVVKRKSAK